MSDIVEIMARAMHDAEWARWTRDGTAPEEHHWIGAARACLAALEKEGWVVVPREPTPLMIQAAHPAARNQSWSLNSNPDQENYTVWSAMVAAGRKGE